MPGTGLGPEEAVESGRQVARRWSLGSLAGTDETQVNTRGDYTITNCLNALEETNSFAY